MRLIKVVAAGPARPPRLDEFPVAGELHNPRVDPPFAVGYINLTIETERHAAGVAELVLPESSNPRRADRHQKIPLPIELQDPIAAWRRPFRKYAGLSDRVGHPEVALSVENQIIRVDHQALAPGFQELA